MFYSNDDVSEVIICPKCREPLKDPRLLPCGETLCNECINPMSSSFTDVYDCFFCSEKHSIPDNGFLPVKSLSRLAKKKPHQVYRSRKVEELKVLLLKLKSETHELESIMKSSKDKVSNYCESMRSEIQTITDAVIKSIERYRDEMVQEVNSYERKCVNSIETNLQINNDFLKFLIESNEFTKKTFAYLKQFIINDEEVYDIIQQAKEHVLKVEKNHYALKKHMFSTFQLEFKPTNFEFNPESLGKTSYKKQSGYINPTNLHKKHLPLVFGNHIENVNFNFLNNGNISIIFPVNDNNISLFQLNRHGILISQGSIKSYHQIYSLKCIFIESKILILLGSSFISDSSYCQIIDPVKNQVEKEINVDSILISVGANSKSIYFLTKDLKIKIYDFNLNLLSTVGQDTDENAVYYIPSTVTEMQLNDDYYFFKDSYNIRIVDIKNGSLVNNFETNGDIFTVDPDSYVLTYNNSKNCLTYFDFNGEMQFEDKIKCFKPSYMKIDTQNCLFFDKSQCVIYYQ